MRTITRLIVSTPLLAALLASGSVVAQHEGHGDHKGHSKAQHDAKAPVRKGDAYAFETCQITGKKLGSMGDPVVKLYGGREVRYCCGGCTKKFEKDLVTSFAKLDAKIMKDQMGVYPLKTSIVTGKLLPKKPTDFVFGNRLIRVGSDKEKAKFHKEAGKFLAALNKAVIAQQGKAYILKSCPVSGDEYGGGNGKSVDLVVAGRLVRVGCENCTGAVEKNPSKFVALVDAAHKAKHKAKMKKDGTHKAGHDHEKGHGK